MASGRAAFGVLVTDFGVGVGKREDDGTWRHARDHLRRDDSGRRQADKHIRADQRVGERARVGFAANSSCAELGAGSRSGRTTPKMSAMRMFSGFAPSSR